MPGQSDILMLNYMGLVRALAWKIHQKLPRHVELDDLLGYGYVGLAEAAKAFDDRRGIEFSTFAYYRIRGAILDGLSKMSWFSAANYHKGVYREEAPAGEEGQGSGDAQPVDEPRNENADFQAEMSWFRQASDRLTAQPMSAMEGYEPVDSSPSSESRVATKEATHRVRELMDELPAAAAELMRSAYYEGMTLQEAGKRLGRDKSWASRLHAKVLRRFALTLRSEGLE